jgi:signal transduction histidine kinase
MLDLTRLRVLLVEDNAIDARIMIRALREAAETRFEIDHVEDLHGALTKLETEPYDCILLDLTLPDSTKLTALDEVKSSPSDAPVVVLTGLDDPLVAVEAVDRGAHDFLPKSRADGDMVARSIRYAVTRHHSETNLRAANEKLNVAKVRERIAQDLHDTVVQQLFATGMSLQALATRTDSGDVRNALSESVDDIDTAIRQLRQAIFDLYVDEDDDTNVDEIDEIIEHHRAALGFDPSITRQRFSAIPDALRREVAAVVREALANVAKHAVASSVNVEIRATDTAVIVEISDDGQGISPDEISSTARSLTGHGMSNLRRRAEDLGGVFEIGPRASGGTHLKWQVPITS